MPTQINLDRLWKSAFGTSAPTIPPAAPRLTQSLLGESYYSTDQDGIEHFMPVTIGGVLLPFATVDITTTKIIVSTPMTEQKGSVHEIVGSDDYVFIIRAILMGNNYPEKDLIEWNKVFEENKSYTIKCVKTAPFLKGDDKVVIKKINWPASSSEHAQPVQMELLTDRVYSLEVLV